MRTPGEIRTRGRQVRNLVLCPLSYEGAALRGQGVGAEGFEPSVDVHLLYRQARLSDVGALPWGGCRGSNPDRESHNLACTAGTPQPPCPNEVSNLGPPVCKTGALPLSYTGLVPTARLERATVDS